MRKANSTHKVLMGLTLVFTLIAALSFAAFHQADDFCSAAKNCSRQAPPKNGSEMLWDGVSRHFVSLLSIN